MKSAKRFDVAKWARATKPITGKRCCLCSDPAVSEAINEVLRLRRAGKTSVSISQVLAMLRSEFNVPCSPSMLAYCCRTHRGESWSASVA